VAGHCGKQAPISLRVNPNVDPKTHPYISTGLKEAKFGVAYEHALDLYRRAAALPHIAVAGIDCHIGSQLLDPSPFVEALERILALIDQLARPKASSCTTSISVADWVSSTRPIRCSRPLPPT
jgi:diaminopimelate decarboxylase